MTCSQWNDMILFLVLCRWSNFKIGAFRQGTTASKCLLAWQMCVALKQNLWILMIKCAFCSVLILASYQPTNRKSELFSSHLRVFCLKYWWKIVFFSLLGTVHEQLLSQVLFANEQQIRQIKQFSELLSWNGKQRRWELVSLQIKNLHMEVKWTRTTEPISSGFDSASQLQGWIELWVI